MTPVQPDINDYQGREGQMLQKGFELVVNLHVHTSFSDGTGKIEDVISSARKAGLDALLITDHDTLESKEKGFEGYRDGLLIVVGFEISGPHNHYLVFGMDHCPAYDWRRPQEFIDTVQSEKGVGFIAHPFEKGSPMSESGRAFIWDDWGVEGFQGLEIWNHSSAWKTKARNWPSALFHYIFRTGTLMGPDRETLAKWDELGQKKRIAGVGGSDAHAFRADAGPLSVRIFPYEFMFRSINTHVLLPDKPVGDVDKDKASVLTALSHGSSFVAHEKLQSAKGFDFWLENKKARKAGMGMETAFENGDLICWHLPASGFARLIKDGVFLYEHHGVNGEWRVTSPGVYRLEVEYKTVFFGRRPWIFSNPVYVRG